MKTYKIVAKYLDGTTETLTRGIHNRAQANAEAVRIWRDEYNSGRSEHTPSMGHNSGIVDIGTMTEDT